MSSVRPILVPLDGSSTSEHALPLAAVASRAYGIPIHMIHVIESDDGGDGGGRAGELFERYARDVAARHHIELEPGALVTAHGDPAHAILEASRGAAMVAIATHGRGGFKATFVGSVADKVIRGAHVPLLVVPGNAAPTDFGPGPVVVAVDGSDEAERALAPAREAASRLGKELVLLRAFSLLPPVTIDVAYYPPNYLQELEDAARAYLESARQEGERIALVSGPPAEAIEAGAESQNAALLVMASGGKGLAKRLAVGSVTDRVLHSFARPLLIVPPGLD